MFPLYSHSVSLSPHRSHLLIIFRPVKWPPFWCLQVSGGRSLAARQFISPARMPPASLFMLFTLCKEAGAKQHIHSCQVLFLLLMLQSYSDAILHRRPPPLSLSLREPVFKSTRCSLWMFSCVMPRFCPDFKFKLQTPRLFFSISSGAQAMKRPNGLLPFMAPHS